MTLPCIRCQGAGVYGAEMCEACNGSGNHTCDNRGCDEPAVGFNDDGKALCADCLMEWQTEAFEP